MSDAGIHHPAISPAPGGPMTPDGAIVGRRPVELTRDEALGQFAGVRLGRIVFTRNALHALRPVNHIVEGGEINIRTHGDSALARQTSGTGLGGVIIAYEADQSDPVTHRGPPSVRNARLGGVRRDHWR